MQEPETGAHELDHPTTKKKEKQLKEAWNLDILKSAWRIVSSFFINWSFANLANERQANIKKKGSVQGDPYISGDHNPEGPDHTGRMQRCSQMARAKYRIASVYSQNTEEKTKGLEGNNCFHILCELGLKFDESATS